MSTSATRHQNFRFEFETVKNASADSPARTDSPPAAVTAWSLVERALVKPCRRPSSREGTVSHGSSRISTPAARRRTIAASARALCGSGWKPPDTRAGSNVIELAVSLPDLSGFLSLAPSTGIASTRVGPRLRAHEPLEGIVERPRSRLIPSAHRIPAPPAHASTAPCTHCGSRDTEPLARMQRLTCAADDWVQCNECGHVFTTPRWPQV